MVGAIPNCSSAGECNFGFLDYDYIYTLTENPGSLLLNRNSFCSHEESLRLTNRWAGFSDEMLELVVSAVGDLKSSLKGQGSDLMVRFGRAEKILQELVDEVLPFAIGENMLIRRQRDAKTLIVYVFST